MRADVQPLVDRLTADFRQLFADRLVAMVLFGPHAPDESGHVTAADGEPVETLALVERLEFADLEACAGRHHEWSRRGLATPLILGREDFTRSLDAFPLEFGAILARHAVIVGEDPFVGLTVHAGDLRRACEVQARSHVLHLREGYLEAGGEPAAIARLVADSAPALRALLVNLSLLEDRVMTDTAALADHAQRVAGVPASVLAEVLAQSASRVPAGDAARLFPPYLAAMERLAGAIDRWGRG
jgi:hypothetical protein